MFEHGCLVTYVVFGVLCACVLYFGMCTCSVQLSMFQKERPGAGIAQLVVFGLAVHSVAGSILIFR